MAATDDRQPSPFGVLAKRIRESRGYSVADVTSRGQLSSGYLTMIEKGDRGKQIGRDMVLQIAAGLRATDDERDELLRVAGYPPATDLPPSPSFVEAVNTDTKLRADEKRILLDLYASMIRH